MKQDERKVVLRCAVYTRVSAARTPTSRHATWEEYSKRHRPGHGQCDPDRDRPLRVHRRRRAGSTIRVPLDPDVLASTPRDHPGRRRTEATQRAMRTKARVGFVKAFGAAHRWLDELLSDANTSLDSLAVREGKSERSIRMTLSLAFLSPVLAEAAMDGRLPRGFSIRRLTELPVLWSEQWTALGLREPIQTQAAIGG
jgi:hypothetical protein